MRRNFLQSPLLIGLLLVFLLTACTQADAAPPPDSPTEGEITVYTAMDEELAEQYLPHFEEQYPDIKVNLLRESTGIVLQRLFDEADDPQGDVVWSVSATALLLAEWNDLLEPYAPAGVERISPRFRDTASPPNWVGNDVFMSAFCVNTVQLEELDLPMPQSWEDLLDPVYEGHLVMPNPATSGTAYLSVSALLYYYGEQNGWDYLDQLHQNIALYTSSGSKPCRLAAAGEYAIAIGGEDDGIALERDGEPIKTVFPAEGSGWNIRSSALIRKDRVKQAAQTFYDWIISDEAMKLYARDRMLITVDLEDRPVFEGGLADPAAQLMEIDIPWAAANLTNIATEWLERYGAKAEPSD